MHAYNTARPHQTSFTRGSELKSLGMQILAVTAVLLLAALILMSVSLSRLAESRNEIRSAEDTILEITTTESRLMDFDGVLAAHAVSDDRWYVTRMRDDRVELDEALKKLGYSLQSDSVQMQRYRILVSLVRKHNGLEDQLSRPEHRQDIVRSQTARTARILTDQIRGALWEILNAQRVKRYASYADMIAEARKSFWIAVGVVVLAFLVGWVALSLAGKTKSP